MPEYGKILVRENHYSDTFYAIYLYPVSRPFQIYFCQTSSKNVFTEHLRATVLVFNWALFPSRCCFICLNHVPFFKWLLESVFEEYLLTSIVNLNYKTLHHVLEKVITTAYFQIFFVIFIWKFTFLEQICLRNISCVYLLFVLFCTTYLVHQIYFVFRRKNTIFDLSNLPKSRWWVQFLSRYSYEIYQGLDMTTEFRRQVHLEGITHLRIIKMALDRWDHVSLRKGYNSLLTTVILTNWKCRISKRHKLSSD